MKPQTLTSSAYVVACLVGRPRYLTKGGKVSVDPSCAHDFGSEEAAAEALERFCTVSGWYRNGEWSVYRAVTKTTFEQLGYVPA